MGSLKRTCKRTYNLDHSFFSYLSNSSCPSCHPKKKYFKEILTVASFMASGAFHCNLILITPRMHDADSITYIALPVFCYFFIGHLVFVSQLSNLSIVPRFIFLQLILASVFFITFYIHYLSFFVLMS